MAIDASPIAARTESGGDGIVRMARDAEAAVVAPAAAFLPAALRLAVLWLLPPLRPPFLDAERFSALPRPEPDFLPPPLSLFTVAQARRSASVFETPRFS